LNVLIIGLGSIAKKHIAVLLSINKEIVFYALRSSENYTEETGVISISNISQLKVLPDFVVISNPTSLHAESIRMCMQWDVPLFIEKPVFGSLFGVDDIIGSIHEKNLITYIACNLRFHPVITFIKEWLCNRKKEINEVNVYCGSYLPDWRPCKNFRESYSANKNLGGGVHLDLIHEIDYSVWLFGLPDEARSLKRNVSSLTISTPDFASYQLLYSHFTVSVTLNYYRKVPKRELEILLDDNILTCDLLNCTVVDKDGNFIFEKKNFNMLDTYKAQMRYFLDTLNSGIKPMNPIDEAYSVLKIVLGEA
jgi:predicted dehydrogenase